MTGRGEAVAADFRARLVVIRDFDFVGIAGLPAKTHPILVVDANAVLPASIAGKAFEPVPRRDRELAQIAHPVELCELAANDGPEVGRARGPRSATVHAIEEVLGRGIREAPYHALYYNGRRNSWLVGGHCPSNA